MFAEQEKFKAWLLDQAPEEILNHTYEYTMREDILLWLEYNDIKSAHAKALLRLSDPLEAVFRDLEHHDISHSDDIEDVFADRAKREIEKQRKKQSERER